MEKAKEYRSKYDSCRYEDLVPDKSDSTKSVWKFNSPQHFLSYVQVLHEKFPRGSSSTSSEESGSSFSLSDSLAHAYEVIRGTQFDASQSGNLQALIRNIKRSTRYSEDGHELEVGEYLAGSEKYWLTETSRRSVSRIIDDPLFVVADYNAGYSSESAKKAGLSLFVGMYSRRVVPRRLIVCFGSANTRNGGNPGVQIFIDVSFNDLNGIAKVLHPAMFRRVVFRMLEIYPDLRSGYGSADTPYTEKGLISIQRVMDSTHKLDSYLEQFLGVTKK